jgi:hypothetical protein
MSTARTEDRAPWRHDPSADPGAKTEGGRHDAALSFPFGIGTEATNRPELFRCAVHLISRPRFLHFTLNQHTFTDPRVLLSTAVFVAGAGVCLYDLRLSRGMWLVLVG